MLTRWLAAFALLLALGASTFAAPYESAYTKLDVKKCKTLEFNEEQGWGVWACTGHQGYPYTVAHGDLRDFVGYGPSARTSCAGRNTFNLFNAAGKTIEWRLKDGRPVATILRFHIESDQGKDQFLVVTTLDSEEVCTIGYVDSRVENHNQMARDLADENHATFSCYDDLPIVVSPKYSKAQEFAQQDRCRPHSE